MLVSSLQWYGRLVREVRRTSEVVVARAARFPKLPAMLLRTSSGSAASSRFASAVVTHATYGLLLSRGTCTLIPVTQRLEEDVDIRNIVEQMHYVLDASFTT